MEPSLRMTEPELVSSEWILPPCVRYQVDVEAFCVSNPNAWSLRRNVVGMVLDRLKHPLSHGFRCVVGVLDLKTHTDVDVVLLVSDGLDAGAHDVTSLHDPLK